MKISYTQKCKFHPKKHLLNSQNKRQGETGRDKINT